MKTEAKWLAIQESWGMDRSMRVDSAAPVFLWQSSWNLIMDRGIWTVGCESWDIGDGIWAVGCESWDMGDGIWVVGGESWDMGGRMWVMGCGR